MMTVSPTIVATVRQQLTDLLPNAWVEAYPSGTAKIQTHNLESTYALIAELERGHAAVVAMEKVEAVRQTMRVELLDRGLMIGVLDTPIISDDDNPAKRAAERMLASTYRILKSALATTATPVTPATEEKPE